MDLNVYFSWKKQVWKGHILYYSNDTIPGKGRTINTVNGQWREEGVWLCET